MNHYSRAGSRLSTTGGGGACVGASYAINVRLPPLFAAGTPCSHPSFPLLKNKKTCVELLSFADALQSISCWAQTEARITGLGSYIK